MSKLTGIFGVHFSLKVVIYILPNRALSMNLRLDEVVLPHNVLNRVNACYTAPKVPWKLLFIKKKKPLVPSLLPFL